MENGPGRAKKREHLDHDVRHVKSRRAGPEAHLQEVGILTKLPAVLLGLVLGRNRRRRHQHRRGRKLQLLHQPFEISDAAVTIGSSSRR